MPELPPGTSGLMWPPALSSEDLLPTILPLPIPKAVCLSDNYRFRLCSSEPLSEAPLSKNVLCLKNNNS